MNQPYATLSAIAYYSITDSGTIFNGTAYRPRLRKHNLFPRKNGIERFSGIRMFDLVLVFVIIVGRSMIAQFAGGIKNKQLRSTLSTIGTSDLLTLIIEIGEYIVFFDSTSSHILKAIGGILRSIVRANRQHMHTLWIVIVYNLYQPIFPGLCIGTMVTGENHNQGFCYC